MSRFFTYKQKQALYWLAGGRCEQCGVLLSSDWHADHIIPYSHDGQTDVINGQALCRACNLSKGSKIMRQQWPENIILRRWQQQFLTRYRAVEKRNFLLVATPGAGKTTASLRAMYDLLSSGVGQKIVVVCPTDHLRTQWLHEASHVGIQLDKITKGWSKEITQTPDYVGLVTTYAEVLSNTDQLRAYTSRFKTVVILDEIHHCGDHIHLQWGVAIGKAFEYAVRRLLLSGTPFRSDNNKIPFVEYESEGINPKVFRSKPDFSYGYGDALKDEEVVRHVIFPGWDGKFVWSDWFGDERIESFQAPLTKSESAHRLRTAINANGQAMKTMLAKASQKLDEVRRDGHTNAGGLVVASDQNAAKALAKILEGITGERPVLAISEIGDEASLEIDKFRTGMHKWIVAVKMVSEGVDIKRLRVGVYATNVTTETFFRQVIGRVIRWDQKWNDLDDQTAWFYVPEDPELLKLVKTIKQEVDHVIEEKEEQDKRNSNGDGTSRPLQPVLGEYTFLSSEGDEKHHHTSGETFPMDELAQAELRFAGSPGFERIPPAHKALFLRNLAMSGPSQPTVQPIQQPNSTSEPAYLRKDKLRKTIRAKVGRLVYLCQSNGIPIPGDHPYQVINNTWGRIRGYSHEMTNDDLERKLEWLEKLISRALKGDKSVGSEFR